MRTQSLDGTWNLTYKDRDGRAWGRSLLATVPGDVHLDLLAAGLIAEPLVSDNDERCRWVEDKTWIYERSFAVDAAFPGRRTELVFEGLDLSALIFLNGCEIGHTENMFIAHRFDVSGNVRSGNNSLTVILAPCVDSVNDKPLEPYSKSWNAFELRRLWMRKAQQSFFWDMAPRMVTCGIWRGVRLESFDDFALRDMRAVSRATGGSAIITCELEIESFPDAEVDCVLTVSCDDSSTHAESKAPLVLVRGLNRAAIDLRIEEAELWWPNGLGNPHLYDLRAELRTTIAARACAGSVETRTLKHGIRSVEILKNALGGKEKTFTFAVNGVKVFCKGGNWVPPDAIFARISKEKQVRLLELAKSCNFNMIRVWGGGVYPDEDFYDACDRLGLMVWQDFMFACGYYPDSDQGYMAGISVEAESIIRKFRNRASLVLWCGNNENKEMFERDKDPAKVFHGKRIFDELLPRLCERFDAERIYHPGSPYPNSLDEGDQHVWGYTLGWKEGSAKAMRLWDYAEDNIKFLSEFGIFCPSNLNSVSKFLGEHPLSGELRFGGKGNPIGPGPVYLRHDDYFEGGDYIVEALRRFYSDRPVASLEEFTIAGQLIQAEALKHLFEELRSRMFTCSGTLFWEYDDCWPFVGFSPVDYYLSIKPLYHYMRRAFMPIHAAFHGGERRLSILNDERFDAELDLEYGCVRFDGAPVFKERAKLTARATSSTLVADLAERVSGIDRPESCFLFAKVYRDGTAVCANRAFVVPIKNLDLPSERLETSLSRTDHQSWELEIGSREFVLMATLEADDRFEYDDNAFDLWPGERRRVAIRTDRAYDSIAPKIFTINRFMKGLGA